MPNITNVWHFVLSVRKPMILFFIIIISSSSISVKS